MRPVDRAAVDAHPTGYVDGDHRRRQGSHHLCCSTAKPRLAADAHDAVEHEVSVTSRLVDDDPAAAAKVSQPRLVRRLAEQHSRHPSAAVGQPSPSKQRVPSVVAAAHQNQHPAAVDTTEIVSAGAREPGSGALHQGASRQRAHERRLGGAHVVDAMD